MDNDEPEYLSTDWSCTLRESSSPKTDDIQTLWKTAVLAQQDGLTTPSVSPTLLRRPRRLAARRRKRQRRLIVAALMTTVFICLLWMVRRAEPLTITNISVRATPQTISCGQTVRIQATIKSKGTGSFEYHWLRSDETDSGPLQQTVTSRDSTLILPLRWTLHGRGKFAGHATFEIYSPKHQVGRVDFVYRCS